MCNYAGETSNKPSNVGRNSQEWTKFLSRLREECTGYHARIIPVCPNPSSTDPVGQNFYLIQPTLVIFHLHFDPHVSQLTKHHLQELEILRTGHGPDDNIFDVHQQEQ